MLSILPTGFEVICQSYDGERMADLPVMAEWIDHAAQAPCMRFLHREDLSRTCRQCLREHRIRIRNGKD